jgi:protein-tyrosine phosphatase
MIATELHWVKGPWPGKLALAARPRGGDWLADEMDRWQREGIHTVVSLLTPQEEQDLDLAGEERTVKAHRMAFRSFPIEDRQVPDSEVKLTKLLAQIDQDLGSGKNVALHCRQGIGRSGLVAACLFVTKGFDVGVAIKRLSSVRGVSIPETMEQRRWIDRFAGTLVR